MRICDWSSDVCSSDLFRMQIAIGTLQVETGQRAKEHVHLRPVQCGRRGTEIARDNQTFEDQRRSALNVLIFGQKRRDVRANRHYAEDRKSVGKGKGVSVRLDLGGRRHIKQKKE